MSEERLAGIEDSLGTVKGDLRTVKSDLDTVKSDLSAVKSDLGVVKSDLDTVKSDLGVVKSDLGAVKSELGALATRVDDLDRHMHVLHKDVIDRIAAIPTDGPTKAEMKQGFDDLREAIGRRLDPLEATVLRHTAEIEQLKNARG